MKRWAWPALLAGLMLLLVIPLSEAHAEGKLIEDPVLEQAIKKQLNLDESEELTEEALLELTSLYPQEEGKVQSLKGLEHALNLKSLYAPNQEIKDLSPLKQLTEIKILGLEHNQIENVCPLASLYQLQQLVISDNQISSIDCLAQNSHLTDLLIGNNQIEDITALAHLPLKWLSLSGNQIKDVQALEDHPTLQLVFLNNNQVQDIRPLASIKMLTTLYIENNPLHDEGKNILDELRRQGVTINQMPSMRSDPNEIIVKLDWKQISFDEAPFVENGITLVQLRPLFEALGLQIEWDERNQIVSGKKQGLQITLKVNDLTATVNGIQQQLPSAPKVKNGNLFVPVRFISEVMHYDMVWKETYKTINIYKDLREFKSLDNRWSFKAGHKWEERFKPEYYPIDVYAVFNTSELMVLEDRYSSIKNLQDYIEDINSHDDGVKPISEIKNFKVNGLNAVQRLYSFEMNSSRFIAEQIVIQGKDIFYRISLLMPETDFDESSTELLDIARTFQEIPTPEEKIAEKYKGKSAAERIYEIFAYYKEMGFFQPMDVNEVEKNFIDNYPNDFAADKDFDPYQDHTIYQRYADHFILQLDKNRVWMEDTEADVGKGNQVYVKALQDWARISRGAFNPSDIVETWNTEEGPIKVQLNLNGENVTLYPQYMNDFMDVGILKKINTKIAGSGYQFAVIHVDQQAFVTVLNEKELAQITKERFWPIEHF
ncbi:stalk domain-containing protein [Paenibacillus sp. 32352]|uniref:stalk domain-containing protein n=1 Tax=Paenibacillus sp. 32352 TaxID=1969111 RepID=UPI0009ACB324|nr:stalk domain-containing protein [Paenibacillus sp. 32352]